MQRGTEEYRAFSKRRLEDNITKKIKTTMIGSIDSIEKNFDFLWGNIETDQEKEVYAAFQAARAEIMKKGHKQMENLLAETKMYSIEWERYNLTIPVKRNLSHSEEGKN